MLAEILRRNLDVVFLIYGAAFFAMGIAIIMKQRQESVFSLANILWLLAGFGIIHGINEWLDMFNIIKKYDSDAWGIARVSVLTLSYIFLFEFGRRLVSLSSRRFLNKWATLCLCFIISVLVFSVECEQSIWPRYLLGFPGALLAAYGFILYYRSNKSVLNLFNVRKYFITAAVFAGIYGILGGLITPRAGFPPASIINTGSFLHLFGVPVQVFRAICAVVLAWSVCNILNIFDWEVIGELKNSLQEVTTAKAYVDNIIKSIVDILLVVDSEARIKLANEAACQVLGYARADLLGRQAQEIFADTGLFDGVKLNKLAESGQLKNYELTCLSKDKERIPVLFSGSAIKDLSGESTEVVIVGRDLRQLRSLQERLAWTEKLAAMGKVAGIIGHEFRNQLGVIRNSVYFIKMKLPDKDEKIKRHLDILEQEVREADRIVENILTFSRRKQPELRNVDLENLLLSMANKMRIPSGVIVTYQIAADLPNIQADDLQLSRVFMNIILNASEAMGGRGELIIKAQAENEYINLTFKDSGPGIKEEDKKHIFEPFFSTKPQGTGLGLATSKVIIEAHGGNIDIESSPGAGAAVKIKLLIKGI